MKNTKIIRNNGGWFLSIEAPNNKKALISIESIIKDRGPIVKSAIRQWAIDNTSQTNTPTKEGE